MRQDALTVFVSILYILFLAGFSYFYLRRIRVKSVKNSFFRALKGILEAEKDPSSQEKQLNLIPEKSAKNIV
jgi:hypothetical protein